MVTTYTQRQKRIMRRIYIVHALRFVLSPMVIKPIVALVLVLRLSRYVSFAHVFENIPRDIGRLPKFVSSAFINTEIASLVLFAITTFVAVWFVRDMFVRKMA